MARRYDIDKSAIEAEYRLGQMTYEELCTKFGISKSTLASYAKAGNWKRDQTEIVKAATKTSILRATVAAENRARDERRENQRTSGIDTPEEPMTEVDVAAEVNMRVIMGHRNGIKRLQKLTGTLTGELEVITDDMHSLAELIQMVRDDDADVRSKLIKLASLPSRVATAERLTNNYVKLIMAERVAFALDDDGKNTGASSIEDVLREVSRLA